MNKVWRALALALGVFGVLLLVGSAILAYAAIWSSGVTAGRLGSTGLLAFFAGDIAAMAGFLIADHLKVRH